MKPLDFHHGYAPITHPVKRLLHKGKFNSPNEMCRLTRQYISFHSTICTISPREMTQIARQFDADCNAIAVQRWRRCTFDSPGLASAYPGLCM